MLIAPFDLKKTDSICPSLRIFNNSGFLNVLILILVKELVPLAPSRSDEELAVEREALATVCQKKAPPVQAGLFNTHMPWA